MRDPFEQWRQRATFLGRRAIDELLTSAEGRKALEMAARGVQEGRRLVDENVPRLISAMGFATQEDVERLGRRLGRLRKRLQHLVDELEGDGTGVSTPS